RRINSRVKRRCPQIGLVGPGRIRSGSVFLCNGVHPLTQAAVPGLLNLGPFANRHHLQWSDEDLAKVVKTLPSGWNVVRNAAKGLPSNRVPHARHQSLFKSIDRLAVLRFRAPAAYR